MSTIITLAKVKNQLVIEYFTGSSDLINYGTGGLEEEIIVPFPEWAKKIREENERQKVANRVIYWNYDKKEFIIKDYEPDWDAARIAHIDRLRKIRNQILVYTDWIDNTDRLSDDIRNKMLNYRQELRAVTSHQALQSASSFELWCRNNNKEPMPQDFMPKRDDIINSFLNGLQITL